MALDRTNPMHLWRRTRGSSALTGIGKHGPLASHVSLQLRPSLNRAWATAVGTKSMSWSMNWPHCISMWLYVSSGVTRDVDRTPTETARALGIRTPLYSRPASQPTSFIDIVVSQCTDERLLTNHSSSTRLLQNKQKITFCRRNAVRQGGYCYRDVDVWLSVCLSC